MAEKSSFVLFKLYCYSMSKKVFLFLIVLLWAFLILSFCFLFYQIQTSDYQSFILFLASLLHKPNWVETIQSLFSPSDYSFAKTISFALLIVFVFVNGILYYFRKWLVEKLSNYVGWLSKHMHQFISLICSYSRIEQAILLVITLFFLTKSYFYIFTFPIQYDEAWTFLHYINNSWLVPFITPHNNHILYTIVAKLFFNSTLKYC